MYYGKYNMETTKQLELPPQSKQISNPQGFRAGKQSKALLTVTKSSYKYVSTSTPCSDEETLIDIATLNKKDNIIPIPMVCEHSIGVFILL